MGLSADIDGIHLTLLDETNASPQYHGRVALRIGKEVGVLSAKGVLTLLGFLSDVEANDEAVRILRHAAEATAHPSPNWQVGAYGRCRFMLPKRWPRRACGAATIASLLRGQSRPQRWGYCGRHLAEYGRVVRNGQVWWDPAAALVVKETLP